MCIFKKDLLVELNQIICHRTAIHTQLPTIPTDDSNGGNELQQSNSTLYLAICDDVKYISRYQNFLTE